MNGYIEKINNDFISLDNIRASKGLSFLVYIKIIKDMNNLFFFIKIF